MSKTPCLMEDYRCADEKRRWHLFRTHRDLQIAFMAIERDEFLHLQMAHRSVADRSLDGHAGQNMHPV